MIDSHGEREYRPALISRRGEWIAWGLALAASAAWLLLIILGRPVYAPLPILIGLLVLSGLAISLGNWMDRRTVLRMDKAGLSFQNGLRNVRLAWPEIHEIQVWPAAWGSRVEVIGKLAGGEPVHFAFRTLGELKLQGEVRGRMGFEKGDEMLQQLIHSGGLQKVDRPGKAYTYARK